MSNSVSLQEGYSIPFAGARKRRKGKRGSARHLGAWQGKMKACAKKWDGDGSYKSHMKDCLRKGR